MIRSFSDEQRRTLVNLAQQYEAWMDAERTLAGLPYGMARKEVGGRAYLYEIGDRRGNARSLGPWSDAAAAQLESYRQTKNDAKLRRDASSAVLQDTIRVYRSLRLPLLASEAGAVLRAADRARLLGERLLLVGTNALPAYVVEAGGFIDEAPAETYDMDLAWTAAEAGDGSQEIWSMLKSVDGTYTVNTERPFQARNAAAYEVEILVAPSRVATLARRDQPRPVPMPEQEWLLNGMAVDHVVVCRDGSPARIVAPDPRWFALQKLWLANQDKRSALKRPKDRAQALALLEAVYSAMPQYPLDQAFGSSLPAELSPLFERWLADQPERPSPDW